MNNKKYLLVSSLIVIAIIFVSLGGYSLYKNNEWTDNEDPNMENQAVKEKDYKEEETEEIIKITSLGNILFHEKQILGAKKGEGYDFKPSFEYIKKE